MKKFTTLLVSTFAVFVISWTANAAETIFNSKGERIELKDDGTYVNHGVPTASDGFIFSIIATKPSTIKWGDETTKESCKLKVKLVNNSQFNIKRVMLSFKSVDDLGQEFGTMQDGTYSTVRKGESKTSGATNLRGKCLDLIDGLWKVKGGLNPYAFKVHEEGISTDDLLELVKYSNSGLVKFTNASD